MSSRASAHVSSRARMSSRASAHLSSRASARDLLCVPHGRLRVTQTRSLAVARDDGRPVDLRMDQTGSMRHRDAEWGRPKSGSHEATRRTRSMGARLEGTSEDTITRWTRMSRLESCRADLHRPRTRRRRRADSGQRGRNDQDRRRIHPARTQPTYPVDVRPLRGDARWRSRQERPLWLRDRFALGDGSRPPRLRS